MHIERMTDRIETERLVLFPYTKENLALFNTDLAAFEAAFGVVYRGEELDHLLQGFLKRLESEIADDPDNYLWFTEFLIVLRENSHVIGSIDYKYVPRDGVTEVGYGMNPAYEGRGYMTEALTAFLDFGARRGLRAVRADTLSDNRRSQNVLKRCGFRLLRTEEDRLWWEVRLGPCAAAEETGERPGETAADYIHALRAVIGSRKIILNCAGAVIVRDGKILLQRRSDNGLWGFPGGLLELNETFAQAALREVREETGLEVRLTADLPQSRHGMEQRRPRPHRRGLLHGGDSARDAADGRRISGASFFCGSGASGAVRRGSACGGKGLFGRRPPPAAPREPGPCCLHRERRLI